MNTDLRSYVSALPVFDAQKGGVALLVGGKVSNSKTPPMFSKLAVPYLPNNPPRWPEVTTAIRNILIKYTEGALKAAVDLSAQYINDRHLPDKAIDVIDEAGAAQRILPKSKQKKTITRAEVEDIVAKIARIPPKNISSNDRSALKTLERDLMSVVFGQDKAIDARTDHVDIMGDQKHSQAELFV